MDAKSFLNRDLRATPPRPAVWYGAIIQALLGVIILWVLARAIPDSHPLLQGWIGMVGAVLVLHFGAFRIAALIWQNLGIRAEPIMAAPFRSESLSEFWGKRWNLGFRQLAYDLIFAPMHKKVGAVTAGFVVFIASGLIHDFVISIPAAGGYGLPTAYFVLQGAGITVERSNLGRRLGLRRGVRGWLFMAALTTGPAFLLFHPPFIRHVIIPMMQAIHSL
jgi:alginate O-acetyltransferase complex protein AlgI